jgi:hypothetical protein
MKGKTLMDINSLVRDICNRIAEQHFSEKGDIDQAVETAERQVRQLPNYDELVGLLVHKAVRGLVYDAWHRLNVKIKREAGFYGGPAKVVVGDSESVKRAYESVHRKLIGETNADPSDPMPSGKKGKGK